MMRRKTFNKTPLSLAVSALIAGGGALALSAPAASDTTVNVSGYVKFDAIVDVDNSIPADTFQASSIPMSDDPQSDKDPDFRFHARQSRVRFTTETDLGNNRTVNTLVEGDFFGAGGNEVFSNSSSFRIRHAWATVGSDAGSLGVGQYWTNFMENWFVAYPTTVDFFGPAGKSFVRQAQIRWTAPNGFSVSLENPETSGSGYAGAFSGGALGGNELPDLTVAWRGGPGGSGGSYEISGVLRKLTVNGVAPEGTPLAGTRIDQSETGWGINLSGGWDLGAVELMGSVTFGDGIGRYLIHGFNNDVFVRADGRVETVESLGAMAGIKFNWTPSSSSLLALGRFENDVPAQSNGIDEITTIHLNYMWSPFRATTFGVEAIYGELDLADGRSNDATRLQFAAQYNF